MKCPFLIPRKRRASFNDYFVLQTELPLANAVPPIIQPYQTQQFLSNIIATEEQVLELMKGVDISKACGYDGIGNKIIKLCSEGFHVYFTYFINLSLSLGQYPSAWKLANVIPLATEEQVLELMKGVDISKACGYDGIGNKIIKLCSEGFHVYFTYFINLSLSLGQYPAHGNLQMLFLFLKMTTLNTK